MLRENILTSFLLCSKRIAYLSINSFHSLFSINSFKEVTIHYYLRKQRASDPVKLLEAFWTDWTCFPIFSLGVGHFWTGYQPGSFFPLSPNYLHKYKEKVFIFLVDEVLWLVKIWLCSRGTCSKIVFETSCKTNC